MGKIEQGTNLINKSDIAKAIGMNNALGRAAGAVAMSVMGLNEINKLYRNFSHLYGLDCTEAALKEFRVSTDIIKEQLEYIPKEGPFIIVSNHPFGGWDGVILYDTIARIRPDLKIITNFILSMIPNLKDAFLDVNPFSGNKNLRSSLGGIKAAKEHLEQGGCLAIFPSGEVSTYYDGLPYTADKSWAQGIMKLVYNAGVPVIPVYFDGENSRKFHRLGKIHPILRTVNLPNELLKRQGHTVSMRIGKALIPAEVAKYENAAALGAYLKSRVYAMESQIERSAAPVIENLQPLIRPIDPEILEKEITATELLFTAAKYSCYLADTGQIPNMMKELGLRREESFREVGEGTGKEMDLDRYDEFYQHLILWDSEAKKLVGAYRLGIGEDIYPKYGKEGFYTSTLFNYSEEFEKLLPKTIELGRSFLSTEYKKEALPLMLLIKGLLHAVIKHENCKYFFGPASISSWIPYFYRSLIIYTIEQNFTPDSVKGLVTSKTPFKHDFLRTDPAVLLEGKMGSLDTLDKYLQKISDNKYRVPTLFKKYVKLGAHIISFNVDPEFNYCVDGMILLDLANVPQSEIAALTRGSEDPESLLNAFAKVQDRNRSLPKGDI